MNETRDPLESLEALSKNASDLAEHLKATFYGPDSTFARALKGAEWSESLQDILLKVSTTLSQIELTDGERKSWQRLQQIALLYVGDQKLPDFRFVLPHADALFAEPDDGAVPTVLESELKSLKPAIAFLKDKKRGWNKPVDKWNVVDWRLLGFVQDWLRDATDENTDSLIERTPIFLADHHRGTALTLAIERLPGPPRTITPHSLRLGMIPLGENNELPQTIRKRFWMFSEIDRT